MNDPRWWHAVTAGFFMLVDLMHVLGNVVSSPCGGALEQRLGTKRYAIVYAIGLLGGSLAWTLANWESVTPAWGASGAPSGCLGRIWPGGLETRFPFL